MTEDIDNRANLLSLNHEIRELEQHLNVAKLRRKLANLSLVFGPILALLMYVFWWIPFVPETTKLIILAPAALLVVWCIISVIFLKANPGGPGLKNEHGNYRHAGEWKIRVTEGELELNLAMQRDTRKHMIANMDTAPKVRRVAYKEDAYADIDGLRTESNRYRRTHNILQGVLIIGSLAATGASGVASGMDPMRWVILGVTFIVGISSGFMGYFKYKERSFYLQQTADAIEHEWEAVEVGVGRYEHIEGEDKRLEAFVAEVHRLKSEQKKRQQNLEQPAEARNPNE